MVGRKPPYEDGERLKEWKGMEREIFEVIIISQQRESPSLGIDLLVLISAEKPWKWVKKETNNKYD